MDKEELDRRYDKAFGIDRRIYYEKAVAALLNAQRKIDPPPPPKPRPWWRRRWLAFTRRLGTVLLGWGRALGGVD